MKEVGTLTFHSLCHGRNLWISRISLSQNLSLYIFTKVGMYSIGCRYIYTRILIERLVVLILGLLV